MIKAQAISWFQDNLPEFQLVEEKYKNIIKKNYSLSWFTPIDTPVLERLDVLLSKWADDNEIYWIHRVNWEVWDDKWLGLRFDLTVPLARYVAMYEWELTFPFKRQHISRVYRWERPQKGRYREFYQADIDIIWNWKLPLFADVEILTTIYNSLRELDFWKFVININNKKFLEWFLETLEISDIVGTISIIDKKDKLRKDKLQELFIWVWLNDSQISSIFEFIANWEDKTSEDLIKIYSQSSNELLKTWLKELKFVYENLISLWVEEYYIKINPAISRWLNYYTGTVFETFISWEEKLWSISSWGRYENLASNFTKNSYPWVGGSIWLTRLLSVLNNLWKITIWSKTTSEVMIVNMWEDTLSWNLSILKDLRNSWINSEIYLDSDTKIQKQLKYANNKNIRYVIICGSEEFNNWIVQLKNLELWEQIEVKISDIVKNIKK